MGIKRPFEESSLELPYAAKHLNDNKLTSLGEAFSSYGVFQGNNDRGKAEDDYFRSQLFKAFGNDGKDDVPNLADKELDSSAPLSWLTSSSSEEDEGSREPLCGFLFPEFYFPRQTTVQVEDAYSYLLNSSLRKQVPVGPNHQADIPVWDPIAIEGSTRSPKSFAAYENDQNLVGNCIIPLADSKSPSYTNLQVGQGRRDCDCLDRGSARCVRQHVKEARERLKELIGEEKFGDLGFYNMGDEVALNWTADEERVFHEVIYSNPTSPGKNFWKQLSLVFPSRTMKEIVSYYFNVFMLWRRAVQNRSDFLEIDSDDDEWQGSDEVLYGNEGEEDSGSELFLDQDAQVGSEFKNAYSYHDGDDDENYYGNDHYGDDDGDESDDINGGYDFGGEEDFGTGDTDAIEKCDIGCQTSRSEKFLGDVNSEPIVNKLDGNNNVEGHKVGDYSSSTTSSQSWTMGACVSVGGGTELQGNTLDGNFSGYLAGESNGSIDGSEISFLFEPSEDTKLWDDSCTAGMVKGVDLLPTYNMIEEIFGPRTSK